MSANRRVPFAADVHTHFLTGRYVAEARAAGIAHPDGMPGWPEWTPERHLSLMDACGIRRAYLSISSPGVHFGDDDAARRLATHVNEFGTQLVAEHPERFGIFAILPLPAVDYAIAEARHALDDRRSDGVAVLTNASGHYLGHPENNALWAELHQREAIVFVHPTSPPEAQAVSLGRPHPMMEFIFETARAVADLALNGTFERFPGIRWIFSHGGGALPLLADRIELFRTTILGDQDPSHRSVQSQLRDVWFDFAGTPFPHQIPAVVRSFGDRKIVYGSDACWTADAGVEHQVATIDTAPPPLRGGSWRDLANRNSERLFA